MTRARTLLSGGAAFLVLAASLVGVPAALVALGGNPLPAHVPSLDQAWTALSTPDASGTLFIAILTIAGWIGWASFAASTLVEVAGAVSTWQPPALPGPMGLTQGSAAVLVGAVIAAIAVLGTSSPAAAQTAVTTTAAPTAAATAHDTHHVDNTTTRGKDSAQSADTREQVTVTSGDTLWEIADEELGDGSRYDELVDATEDTTQPDGRHLSDPDLIYPGWTINVPTEATANDAATPAAPDPSTTTGGSNTAAPQTGADEPTSRASAPSPADASPTDAGDAGRSEPTLTPSGPPTTTPTTTAETASSDTDHTPVLLTTAGLGALAAAGVLTLLRRRRDRQNQHRAPGKRVALPTGDAAIAEAQMRAAADPLAAHDLDRVLRSLAAHATAAHESLPALRAARLCADSLELYLVDEDAVLPEPFTPDGPGVWVLERAAMTDDVLLSVDEADEHLAPYPSLVTVGHDKAGAHVLLNLEELRSLSLIGDDEVCTAALSAMTIELLGSTWTDDTRITLVGIMPELIDAIGSDRATYVDTLDEILTALEYTTQVVRGALDDAAVDSAQDARTEGVVDDSWTPHLILLTGPIDARQQERLSTVLEATPRVAVASVVTGAPAMGEWTLTLAGDTSEPTAATGSLAPIGLQITPQMLPRATYEATLDAFRAADLPDIDGPEWADGIADSGAVDLDSITLPQVPVPLAADDDPYGITATAAATSTPPPETTPTAEAPSAHDDAAPLQPVHDGMEHEDVVVEDDVAEGPNSSGPAADVDLEEEDLDAAAAEDLETDDEAAEPAPTDDDDLEPSLVDAPEGFTEELLALPADRPHVRLLGPVHVAGATGKKPTAPRRMTEIVVYLALHGGHGPQAFTEAIFPTDRSTKAGQKRNQYMTSARHWLGHAPHGQPYVAIVNDGGYRLDEATAVDWWLFQDLVSSTGDISTAPTKNLRAALDLVDGQPLSGTDEDRYAWADTDRQEIIAAVADVAHELARRALDIGDARTATLAAAKGLEVEPVSEALWRDAIAAAYSTGQPGRPQQVIADCRRRLDEYGDLEEDTIDLINDVLTRVRATDSTTVPEPVHT